jgi:hypothetical protein
VGRQILGWATPAVALIALFGIRFLAPRDGGLDFWLAALVVAAVGVILGAAAEVHGRLHPAFSRIADRVGLTLWILPGLLIWTAGFALVLWRPDDLFMGPGLPLLGALLVGLAIFAQDRELALAADAGESSALPKQLLSLLTYLAAFGLFTLVYQIKERSLISATTTAFVAALLSLVLLRGSGAPLNRTLLYGALIGLALGEVTWALNYWVVRELVGGAVLLLIYYVTVGLIEIVLRGELSRRLLAEYLGVGIVGFLFILSTAPWRP